MGLNLHQIAENVLDGKLKGVFVLRNGERISSDNLTREKGSGCTTHWYDLHNGHDYIMYDYGLENVYGTNRHLDVVDFEETKD